MARLLLTCMAACLCAGLGHAQTPSLESDYFQELPVVLSVSRLAQPIQDTPGAVTIIERQHIRDLGARDISEVLRLVPGYLVSGYNGANPNAAYHLPLDDFGIRNLVLVNGRSLYSPFYLGGTARGLSTVHPDEVERIEVLRGANSAVYGAHAMFGVVNIVTRHADDTRGVELGINQGGGGVQDRYLRVGKGTDSVGWRLSASERADGGYLNLYDDRQLRSLSLRADGRPSAQDEWSLEAGASERLAGEGTGSAGNSFRTVTWRDWHLHAQWQRQQNERERTKWSISLGQERLTDLAYMPTGSLVFPDIALDSSGKGRQLDVEWQNQSVIAENLRWAWGAGYKADQAQSLGLFNASEPLTQTEWRFFSTAEWRPAPRWTLNGGLLWAHGSRSGAYTAPRLMVNHQIAPDHTLRAGFNRSVRPPTLYELGADVRLYSGSLWVAHLQKSSGRVVPETLYSRELGYFGHFRAARSTLDVRLYRERMGSVVRSVKTSTVALPLQNGRELVDFENAPGASLTGLEYQWRWSPQPGSELWLNQHWNQHRAPDTNGRGNAPPVRATTIAWFQDLPAQWRAGLIYQTQGAMSWRNVSKTLPATQRLDLRLAHAFRLASTKGELAVTWQSALGREPTFATERPAPFFPRRVFATLRLDY